MVFFTLGSYSLRLAEPVYRFLGAVEKALAVIVAAWLVLRLVEILVAIFAARLEKRGNRSAVAVLSSEISEGSSYGIRIYECSPQIKGSVISNNGGDGIYTYASSSGYGSSPVIEGNTIADNAGQGIYHYRRYQGGSAPESGLR